MSYRAVVSFADGINVKMSVRLLVQQCTAARLRLPSDETLEIGQGMVVFVCFNKVIRHPFFCVFSPPFFAVIVFSITVYVYCNV